MKTITATVSDESEMTASLEGAYNIFKEFEVEAEIVAYAGFVIGDVPDDKIPLILEKFGTNYRINGL